jgi:hypothetical protein
LLPLHLLRAFVRAWVMIMRAVAPGEDERGEAAGADLIRIPVRPRWYIQEVREFLQPSLRDWRGAAPLASLRSCPHAEAQGSPRAVPPDGGLPPVERRPEGRRHATNLPDEPPTCGMDSALRQRLQRGIGGSLRLRWRWSAAVLECGPYPGRGHTIAARIPLFSFGVKNVPTGLNNASSRTYVGLRGGDGA